MPAGRGRFATDREAKDVAIEIESCLHVRDCDRCVVDAENHGFGCSLQYERAVPQRLRGKAAGMVL